MKSGGGGSIGAVEKLWKETVAEYYPVEEGDEEGKSPEKNVEPPENFPEERIDLLLKQKAYFVSLSEVISKSKGHSSNA